MNEAKLERKSEGLNSQARKVLEAVPIQSAWSKEKIVAELRRTGSNAGKDVIESCLNVLRGHGLIREPEAGQFIRVEARAKTVQPEMKVVPSISNQVASKLSPRALISDAPEDKLPGRLILFALRMESFAELAEEMLSEAVAMRELAADLAAAAEAEIAKAKSENALPQETMAALKTLGLIKA